MEELRFIERQDRSLIVADDSGKQYRLAVNDELLTEVRQLAKLERTSGPKVSPRLIQTLLRSGKSHDQVMEETGAEAPDIERYEGPILAEFRYILETAHAVPVRAETPDDEARQVFGEIITLRLEQLGASSHTWTTWRDEEDGWMVKVVFTSHNVEHEAVWSFDHKKLLLTPKNSDAVNLSKQGQVGDRLIPTLRAVDSSSSDERFDSGAFEPLKVTAQPDEDAAEVDEEQLASARRHPSAQAKGDDEYSRRREIDQRAISSDEQPQDLGETADLLDALRRRRGAREQSHEPNSDHSHSGAEVPARSTTEPGTRDSAPGAVSDQQTAPDSSETATTPSEDAPKKGRTAMPSWDEILFGTRSEED